MIYLISYDLNKPGQNYADLYEAIKSTGAWWHHLDSTWLVDTQLTAVQVSEKLRPCIDNNDNLLVIGVTKEYAGWLSKTAWDWLRERVKKAA